MPRRSRAALLGACLDLPLLAVAVATVMAALTLVSPARAELLEASSSGFDLSLEVTVPASPEAAFGQFTGEVHRWWNGAHTFSADAGNLTLDADCLCERWGNGAQVRHLAVGLFLPPATLRLLGGLGPLQGLPVTGVMDITFAPADGQTRVALAYAVRGEGLADWAAPVEAVLAEQLERYRAFVTARERSGEPE